MTSLVDEDNAPAAVTEPSPEPAAVVPEPPRKRRSMAWVGYLVLLLVVALAVGGWFVLQELRSRQEGLGGQITNKEQQVLEASRQLNSAQSELAALHTQVAALQAQLATGDSKFEREISEQTTRLNERLETTRSEFSAAIQQIQRQLNKNRGDLLIADAEYLLSIANQKLHLIGDIKAVLAAMEAADQRLHDSGDPAVFKVREALAQEIALLKKLEAPDVVGISAKLLDLENKAAHLPLFLPHAGKVAEQRQQDMARQPKPEDTDADAPKKDVLESTLDELKDLITVRRTDRPIEAILTPEEAEALRQVLLLKLETGRVALLRGDQQLYQDSLGSARDWVKQHFDQSAAETREIQEELTALLGQPISIPFPDVSKSLSLLRNIENLRIDAEEAAARPRGSAATAPKPATPEPPGPAPAQVGPVLGTEPGASP